MKIQDLLNPTSRVSSPIPDPSLVTSSNLASTSDIEVKKRRSNRMDDGSPILGNSLSDLNIDETHVFNKNDRADLIYAARCLEYLHKIKWRGTLPPKSKVFDDSLYSLVKHQIDQQADGELYMAQGKFGDGNHIKNSRITRDLLRYEGGKDT